MLELLAAGSTRALSKIAKIAAPRWICVPEVRRRRLLKFWVPAVPALVRYFSRGQLARPVARFSVTKCEIAAAAPHARMGCCEASAGGLVRSSSPKRHPTVIWAATGLS
jgi:hypothetical protein